MLLPLSLFIFLGLVWFASISICIAQTDWEQIFDQRTTRIEVSKNGIIAAAVDDSGLVISLNNGETWKLSFTLSENLTCNDIEFDDSENLYIATTIGLYRSSDYGDEWDLLMINEQSSAAIWEIKVSNDGHIFVGFSPGRIARSTDSGQTWNQSDIFIDGLREILLTRDDTVLAFNILEVYRSVDSGDTWVTLSPILGPAYRDAIYVESSSTIYISATEGLMASNDLGMSWYQVSFPTVLSTITALYVQHDNSIVLWALNDMILRSTNDHKGWDDISGSFPSVYTVFEFANDRFGRLYCAAYNGLYRSITPTSILKSSTPAIFSLSQAYPNPVSAGASATVEFTLERAAEVTLEVHDILGRRVRQQSLGQLPLGEHTQAISTTGLQSGMYFYTLTSGANAPVVGKMVVR